MASYFSSHSINFEEKFREYLLNLLRENIFFLKSLHFTLKYSVPNKICLYIYEQKSSSSKNKTKCKINLIFMEYFIKIKSQLNPVYVHRIRTFFTELC